jgi:serine/threonine-protein kinase
MMGDDHLISLQPGTVLGGKYEVVKCLGSGSMGLVYACRHRELQGHMVAVKVLFPEVAQDKVAAARFRNEIFASYGVSHPNVVRAYEYLRDGELVAYTMEYVGGGDLAERLSRQERMPIAEVVRLLSQMAAGVQAIHDAGIVHRDLKPENILLTKEGNVKIADFGIARNRHGPKLTEHGGVVGTIDYVAPEYMLRSQVDWRSDIYAIGILAYEMVTGEAPFRGDSVYATMTKRLKTDPEPPSKLRPECPAALDKVIFKAMHRDPQLRYQAAMEIFMDLQKLAVEQGLRTAVTGGFFMPNQATVNTYVGPSVSAGKEEDTSILTVDGAELGAPTKPEPAPVQPVATGSLADAWQNVGSVGGTSTSPSVPVQRTPLHTGHGEDGPPSATIRVSGAEVRAMSEAAGLNGGNRLESVLGTGIDLPSDGWESSKGGTMSGGTISDRVRDLSYKYHEQQAHRSYLIDAMLLIGAMIFGVGVGFIVLKMVFPSLLSSLPFFGG